MAFLKIYPSARSPIRTLCAVIGFLTAAICPCGENRALIVGINAYTSHCPGGKRPDEVERVVAHPTFHSADRGATRGKWVDLDGAVNDAVAMAEVLKTRFGFEEKDVILLTDAEATREKIFSNFQNHLIDQAKPGDACLFFFAGHGSQVSNRLSMEPDKLDETIVPADSCKGVLDIRDKELARLYNAAIDRGVSLTVISDSCHSGSIARGFGAPMKSRSLPPSGGQVEDAPEAGLPPERRGALIISAAQDYQSAGEKLDRDGLPHGLFSMALLEALKAAPDGEPTDRLFSRVKAFMQSEGRIQEPVLAGSAERLGRPLFGQGATSAVHTPDRPAFAVIKALDEKQVEIQGGLASGIRKNCELVKGGWTPEGGEVRLRVTEVMGLSTSRAELVSRSPMDLKPGDLLELDKWAAPDSAVLRVWMPQWPREKWGEVSKIAKKLKKKCERRKYSWVEDPTGEAPTHVLSIVKTGWVLYDLQDGVESSVTWRQLWRKLKEAKARSGSKVLFYANFPPPPSDLATGPFGFDHQGGPVQVVEDATAADYLLAGAFNGREILYAWLLPNATKADLPGGFHLPIRTDWMPFDPGSESGALPGTALRDSALKLSRLKGWLCLSPPPHSGSFPYSLALKRPADGELVREGYLYDGERFSMTLVADMGTSRDAVEKRYVYVFGIDQHGESKLLFPEIGSGSVENRVPYDKPEKEIKLGNRDVVIKKPFGVDTYILLASAEAIPNPEIFNSSGVRGEKEGGKTISRSGSTPLERFLAGVGSESPKGENYPAGWSLDRITFLSCPAKH